MLEIKHAVSLEFFVESLKFQFIFDFGDIILIKMTSSGVCCTTAKKLL